MHATSILKSPPEPGIIFVGRLNVEQLLKKLCGLVVPRTDFVSPLLPELIQLPERITSPV